MAMSWLYGQLALNLATMGFWDYEYAEAVAYLNEGEMELGRVTPPDDAQNESGKEQDDKPAADIKDDGIYDHFVRIKRKRPEPCDQKVLYWYSIFGLRGSDTFWT